MKEQVKVLFIIWSLEKGGAERFLTTLLKNIDKTRIAPVVCCLNWKGVWAREVEDAGVEVIELNKRGKFDLIAFLKLIKIIKNGKFDIVNTHLWAADVIGRMAAMFVGTKVIVSTAQNVDIWKKSWHKNVDKLLSYRTNQVIAVSGAVKEYYHNQVGIPLKKISYIPNAIETERFEDAKSGEYIYKVSGFSANDFILACVGRLTEQKGQKYLLVSLSLLKPRYPNIKILFVGYGEDEKKLKELANKLGVQDSVRFMGYRNDIPQILSISSGLVLPSLYEGLPLCVLEAMAAGKPVIATDAGGTKEVIVNDKTGFLVPYENSEKLSAAIEKLFNLPDQGKKMGEKAREVVNVDYSIRSVADQTAELFCNLVSKT